LNKNISNSNNINNDESIHNLEYDRLTYSPELDEPTYSPEPNGLTHKGLTHDFELGEPICDFELDRPTYNFIVENKDVRGCPEEKLWFKLRKGCIKKTPDRAIQKRTILCEHSGEYKSKNMKSIRETSTKCIGCQWYANLSQSIKNNPNGNVYLTTLKDEYNHNLSSYRTKFFNDNELTQE
ncbi:8815_t:CDS:2, partial [Racocetra persica]